MQEVPGAVEYASPQRPQEQRPRWGQTWMVQRPLLAVAEAAAEKIRLAYEDDRKMKILRDELEKERRDARIAAAARRAEEKKKRETTRQESPDQEDEEQDSTMPGDGNVLGSSATTSSSPTQSLPSNKKTD